jgi:hypothetical protein
MADAGVGGFLGKKNKGTVATDAINATIIT